MLAAFCAEGFDGFVAIGTKPLDRLPHFSLMAVVLLLHVVGLICAVVFLL